MRLINSETHQVIVEELRLANNPLTRIRGLLFTGNLPKGHGLWLTPCNSIHTVGMQYAIDVLYLDKNNRVVKVLKNLKPNRLGPFAIMARSVVELPAGYLNEVSVALNDRLEPLN